MRFLSDSVGSLGRTERSTKRCDRIWCFVKHQAGKNRDPSLSLGQQAYKSV